LSGSSALIPGLLRNGDGAGAAHEAIAALRETFALDVVAVHFAQDEYSLNSVSGRAVVSDGTFYFFKFHQEDGEEENVTEYYRAHLLDEAGLPVEMPVAVSSTPGAQMVLYRWHREPRMADVCADLERVHGAAACLGPGLLGARRALDARTGDVLLKTLADPVAASARASIHQLFHHRLADKAGRFPGARYLSYYEADPAFAVWAGKRWRVNGVEYRSSLTQVAAEAAALLAPMALAELPVVTAHGDDHHGNVWVTENGASEGGSGGPVLRLFDPAFAANDIPALLAPVKATYHNALAHPFWLYHPMEAAEQFSVKSTVTGNVVEILHNAELSTLRREVLTSAAELIWAPLLRELTRRSCLPANWRQIVRSALFCCPMLVTNLLAADRPSDVRLLGLAQAVAAGSEPVSGSRDDISCFLDEVAP
jgi:hypothetical protein